MDTVRESILLKNTMTQLGVNPDLLTWKSRTYNKTTAFPVPANVSQF